MRKCVLLIMIFGAFLAVVPAVLAQPLLRQGEGDEERQAEPDDEERAQSRRQAQLEEERMLEQQQELMRMQGERMAQEREEIERDRKMMNYALAIAILVVGTTLLIAFARSRVAADAKPPSVPRSPPGAA
ncbi:MAG TPA: hypothetical protein VF278_01315 [Pirellulales bacterium]